MNEIYETIIQELQQLINSGRLIRSVYSENVYFLEFFTFLQDETLAILEFHGTELKFQFVEHQNNVVLNLSDPQSLEQIGKHLQDIINERMSRDYRY